MITRTTVTDDSGTGTDGTIANQAWLTTFYDTLDARWSRHTSTLTGAQNNLDVDEADLVLLNGASDGAFTGLAAPASPAKPGKITIFKNIHASSIVTFAHNSGSSSAGNKFFNLVTSAVTPVSTGGWIAYQYDDVNSRWNLIAHQQGAWIAYTPTWGNTGTANTLGDGAITGAYQISGLRLAFRVALVWGATTASGNGAWTFTYPLTVSVSGQGLVFPVFVQDASFGALVGIGKYLSTTTWVPYAAAGAQGGVLAAAPITWVSTDALYAAGEAELA